jgi:hypothetical protein
VELWRGASVQAGAGGEKASAYRSKNQKIHYEDMKIAQIKTHIGYFWCLFS